jgi:ribonuclease BN (tRNA processing enzyme)
MQASIQFFGAGAPDGGAKTILLTIEGRRYMFNCSPGTQRCALQHSLKFAHMEAVFFTSLKWENYGGFKGMVSTLADIHPFSIELAKKISELAKIREAKSLGIAKVESPPHEINTVHDKHDYFGHKIVAATEDDAEEPVYLELGQIPIIGNKGLQKYINASYSFLKRSIPILKIIEQSSLDEFFKDDLVTIHPCFCENEIIGYKIEGKSVPGKFNTAAAIAKGVKPGPDFGRLLKGESITLENGTVVTSEGIVSPSLKFPTIIIAEYKESSLPPYDIGIFFSQTPSQKDIGENDYFVTTNTCPIMVDGIKIDHELSSVTNLHQPLCWCKPQDDKRPLPLDELFLFPDSKYDRKPSLLTETVPPHASNPVPDHVIVTLGTGAAMPGKYRNVSSTLFIHPKISGLFDCGEASFGQLIRKFGHENALKIIEQLDFIAISHLHSDHHLGLLQILENRNGNNLLRVFAPKDILQFVEAYVEITGTALNQNIQFIENSLTDFQLKEDVIFKSVLVFHCFNSFGFVVHIDGSPFVVFSGDTRPCDELIQAGMNTQILIHEATMPDELEEEAVIRRHVTYSEAVQVSQQINAHLTILTHFSQRYGRTIPESPHNNIICASDFMLIDYTKDFPDIRDLEARASILNKEM